MGSVTKCPGKVGSEINAATWVEALIFMGGNFMTAIDNATMKIMKISTPQKIPVIQ